MQLGLRTTYVAHWPVHRDIRILGYLFKSQVPKPYAQRLDSGDLGWGTGTGILNHHCKTTTPLPILDIVSFIVAILLIECVVVLHWGFNLHFSDDKWLVNLFMYLLVIWMSFLQSICAILLAIFLIDCLFFLLVCKSS